MTARIFSPVMAKDLSASFSGLFANCLPTALSVEVGGPGFSSTARTRTMATTHRRTRSRPPGDPSKVIGYVRVSTGDRALGPEARRTALLVWCAAQGCTLVHVFFDQAVGGAAPADQRPGLSAALAGVKQHGAGILLVATRDRLARDTLIAALVEQRALQLGAAIRAVHGSGNTDTPEGLLVRRVVDAFAEYERLTIQARTKAALP